MSSIPMGMPDIFISYRRGDTIGHAGGLYDGLAQRVGWDHIFRDIDDISAVEDFHGDPHVKNKDGQTALSIAAPR